MKLAWIAALLAGSLCLPCAGAGPASAAKPAKASPNVLLITLDTTRADHLGCYGMKGARTPVLDALASRGALFEQAHASVPLTLPSHAVLLTGQLPSTLNLRVNGLKLREDVETLATRLQSVGYWTAAVVSSVILSRDYGLSRGFSVYDDRMTLAPTGGGDPEERRAEEVTDAALQAVKGANGPAFLWVHYYDPHYDYRPPEPYAKEFQGRLYDGEIAYMDAAIGRLLEGLRKRGFLENALVVVAGDHGEGLMEHGERQHGIFLYEYALHVPLFVVWEGRIPPGRRVGDLCGLDDVAPTVLDLLGSRPEGADGRSLKPLMEGGSLPPRPLYLESYHGYFTYGWAPLRGIMTERYKYIEAPRPELYFWKSGEEKNAFSSSAPEVSDARARLAKYPPAAEAEKGEMEALLKDPSNAETLKRLMSLGYLGGGGARADAVGLLDPKDVIGIQEDLKQAGELMGGGEKEKAKPLLTSVIKRNPQNVPALSMLGLIYLDEGQYEKARACFEEEKRLKPQMEACHLNLGTTYKKMGNAEQAEKEYRAALAIRPSYAEAAANLAQMLLYTDRIEEARKVIEATQKAGGENADLYFQAGVLEAKAKNWEKARFAFTKCLSLDPRRDEALANLGRIAYSQGRLDEAIFQYERACRMAPRKASYLATLGSLYLDGKNDESKALQYFQRALAADPYGPDAPQLKEIVQQLKAHAAAP